VKLLIAGAGAWGTALAIQASQRHAVTLWARHADHLQDMALSRVNQRYLPGIQLPDALALSNTPLAQLLPAADLVMLAAPMAALRGLLTEIATSPAHTPVAGCAKALKPHHQKPVIHLVCWRMKCNSKWQLTCMPVC
jgi:glycerol-3-phosphate dehydrogenase (NAD(P)+)